MFAFLENFLQEWTRRSQDDFVRLHLLTILTHQSYIREIFVILQFLKSRIHILFELIPLHNVLFGQYDGPVVFWLWP